ncbi:MAG: glycosyltransferase family 4 protein [Treponema sp.]|nr:glycosyltransferase family 4 protein [Treponema sp.]
MKIAIDCRWLGASGVGAYLDGCLPLFLKSDNSFLLFGDSDQIAPYTPGNNAIVAECNTKPFSPAELLAFPGDLIKTINQCDIYYSPYFNIPAGIKVPVCVTIHDIIFPDLKIVSFLGLQARMFFYRRAAAKAVAIFTVSEFSKSRITYHLGNKTPVINASIGIKNSAAAATDPHISKKKIIVFIGNIKKHKGLSTLLDAYSACLDKGLDYKLYIIGRKDNFRSGDNEIVQRLEKIKSDNLVFTGYIPDDEKNRLLAEASLLVQPSLYEGFGTPPLEAMAAGTPALISDIPVFREVYADFPVTFFKAGDSADLKDKIMKLLYKKMSMPVVLSAQQRNKYSLEKTVSVILKEMKKNIGNN